ncbi:MAG TPA: TonB-dependent receptor [Thermoanaerobaculia bacterium]|nr:TonB-dependent receptor [Thermoanaerobaculia bacterium]
MKPISRPTLRLVLLALIVATAAMPAPGAAQNTTSTLRIEVAGENGAAVAGVPITITHVPTGRVQAFVADARGVVIARGLAVGGPYEVSVPAGADFAADRVEEIFLELDETEVIALAVRPAAFEEITVTAQEVGAEVTVGVARDFGRSEIAAVPSIARDFVSTLATEPKIVVDNSVSRGPAVSMAGQNFRFNSVTIDGVAQNDNFGLSKNASATQRTPISIDAIEALNANIAPYDVTYGNFIGGNINIVTRSGSNDFTGSVFAVATDDGWTGDESDGDDLGIGAFDEETYGFTLGGPIVGDRLFFFANYESFETTTPSNSQTIGNIAGVTQADVDQVIDILRNDYGFDPGQFATSDVDEDEKVLFKLGWNLSASHRADATYQVADGDVLFDDFPEVAVLQSNRYNINEKLTAYSAQLFSAWTNRFSTELKLGFKDVENRQISVDTTTPDFTIFTPVGGAIAAGGDRFRHANELDNESRVIRIRGDYQTGDHLLTGGFEQEEYTVRNLFLPFSKGNYVFFSPEDLRNRNVGFVLYGNSNTGVADDAEANFDLAVNSLYVQDQWTPTGSFTLKLGLRYDEYSNDDEITLNPSFLARNGFSNQENLDGKDLVLPRLGFSWAARDKITIRGGAGLFGGGTPLIVLSNSYSGDGVSRTFASFLAPFFGPPVSDALAAALAELPDPTAAFRYFQQFIGVNSDAATDAIDPDFDILSTWKYSLGGDFVLPGDWLLHADVVFSDVKDGYDIFEGRRRQVGTAPDGRPIYDLPADGDYIVTNTSEGKGTVFTVTLDKTFDTRNAGRWDLDLGYTNQDVEELRSYDRFVGFETYSFDPQTDLNNGVVAPSRYEIEDRITATVIWQQNLFGDNNSLVGLTYAGRSGRHFSYVFGSGGSPTFGGTFLADFGSEGDNPGSQLFYVPSGPNDPIVTGDAAFLADLDRFISSDKCLSSQRGTIAQRHSCSAPWVSLFNLRLQQQIQAWRDTSFDVILDVENFGNLINSDWGRIETYEEPSNVAPAIVSISADGTRYVLTPNASYQGTPDTIVPALSIARLPSVYRIQLGLRFRF